MNFDTHKAVKNLIAHGITESHAEAIVDTFSDYTNDAATKNDLAGAKQALKFDIGELRSELKQDINEFRDSLKKDIHAVDAKISDLRVEMEKFKGELLLKIPAIIAAMFGAYKVFEKFSN